MIELLQSRSLPIVLLTASNLFMTFAWYGHLKYKSSPLWLVILASWGIAFFEYVLQVPANRWGNAFYSVTQLKILQEVITLGVFSGFVRHSLSRRKNSLEPFAGICLYSGRGGLHLPAEKVRAAACNPRAKN